MEKRVLEIVREYAVKAEAYNQNRLTWGMNVNQLYTMGECTAWKEVLRLLDTIEKQMKEEEEDDKI